MFENCPSSLEHVPKFWNENAGASGADLELDTPAHPYIYIYIGAPPLTVQGRLVKIRGSGN